MWYNGGEHYSDDVCENDTNDGHDEAEDNVDDEWDVVNIDYWYNTATKVLFNQQ